jgi:hypothetical protein
MLPLVRPDGLEPVARVERSARAEDETYSPADKGSQPQPGSEEPQSQTEEYGLEDDGLGLENETSQVETNEGEGGWPGSSVGAAPRFDLPDDSQVQISLFA